MPTETLTDEEMDILNSFRELNQKREENKNSIAYLKIALRFGGMGATAGGEIARLADELHPDNVGVVPLYRGCLVFPKQEPAGGFEIIMYHDPSWMGEERTLDTLPRYKEVLLINGQRSGADLIVNGQKYLAPHMVLDLLYEKSFDSDMDHITENRRIHDMFNSVNEARRLNLPTDALLDSIDDFFVETDKNREAKYKRLAEERLRGIEDRTGGVDLPQLPPEM